MSEQNGRCAGLTTGSPCLFAAQSSSLASCRGGPDDGADGRAQRCTLRHLVVGRVDGRGGGVKVGGRRGSAQGGRAGSLIGSGTQQALRPVELLSIKKAALLPTHYAALLAAATHDPLTSSGSQQSPTSPPPLHVLRTIRKLSVCSQRDRHPTTQAATLILLATLYLRFRAPSSHDPLETVASADGTVHQIKPISRIRFPYGGGNRNIGHMGASGAPSLLRSAFLFFRPVSTCSQISGQERSIHDLGWQRTHPRRPVSSKPSNALSPVLYQPSIWSGTAPGV